MELVQYEVRDRIAHVTIANGKANALSPDVIAGLGDALVARRGRGGDRGRRGPDHRRAGHVLGRLRPEGHAQRRGGGGQARHRRRRALRADVRLARCRSSSRAAGTPIAAGALLLLGADARIGARGEFRIGLIETQLGMVLPRWAVELAQERLSPRHLQDATVGARIYDPEGAVDAGFLDSVVPSEALAAAAEAEAQRWAAFPRAAYRGQVRMCRGERLGRLAEAIAADRGRTFDVPVVMTRSGETPVVASLTVSPA